MSDKTAEEYLEEAYDFEYRGNHDKAIDACVEALELEPNNVEALNLLGVAAEGAKDFETALEAYKDALTIDPDYVLAKENLAGLETDVKRRKDLRYYVIFPAIAFFIILTFSGFLSGEIRGYLVTKNCPPVERGYDPIIIEFQDIESNESFGLESNNICAYYTERILIIEIVSLLFDGLAFLVLAKLLSRNLWLGFVGGIIANGIGNFLTYQAIDLTAPFLTSDLLSQNATLYFTSSALLSFVFLSIPGIIFAVFIKENRLAIPLAVAGIATYIFSAVLAVTHIFIVQEFVAFSSYSYWLGRSSSYLVNAFVGAAYGWVIYKYRDKLVENIKAEFIAEPV